MIPNIDLRVNNTPIPNYYPCSDKAESPYMYLLANGCLRMNESERINAWLRCKDPYQAFASLLDTFYPEEKPEP
ncbi:MAG: hypothetical protein AAFP92_10190, partial [Bacteroidota bacterium]